VTATVIERNFDWINARFVLSHAQRSYMLLSQLQDLIDTNRLREYSVQSDASFFSKTVVKRFHHGMLIPLEETHAPRIELTGLSSTLSFASLFIPH
jgi:hypothetical protein